MRRLIRVAAMAATASVVLASSLAAQAHTVSTFSNPRPAAQQRGAGAPMTFTLLGGIATWFGQGKWRRAARSERANAARLRREVDQLRASAAARTSLPAQGRDAA